MIFFILKFAGSISSSPRYVDVEPPTSFQEHDLQRELVELKAKTSLDEGVDSKQVQYAYGTDAVPHNIAGNCPNLPQNFMRSHIHIIRSHEYSL